MFRHANARRAVLLLMVLAVAFLWTADQGIRAAANDRADASAAPAAPPPAKSADKAAAATTVKDPPPAMTAKGRHDGDNGCRARAGGRRATEAADEPGDGKEAAEARDPRGREGRAPGLAA